ncbi:UDP-N-acetylglucosamine 2-epimerase [Marinobacter sp. AN1]|uniref:UDP-N-acetylglucosamine 2-epimerase n=1 Tax=Marinobacter sp. AN1 TaxID=2886046 RepID=UPI00222FDD78|nr:UDP-N-acetylglucosamine 2-epimerase [Marinobacter sp. AN1]UZD66511.1 UDP-N-acetylglucosamine 2-epimerase [Marinobacter sp. AN1]
MKLRTIFGSRPEAIKMARLAFSLTDDSCFGSQVCVTSQHREMLDQVLDLFRLRDNFDLNLMKPGHTLAAITSRILTGVESVIRKFRPDIVLVYSDTSTTLAASLAAYYQKIPLGHDESGVTVSNLYSLWQDGSNRKLTVAQATLLLAPTESSDQNLLIEDVPGHSILEIDNTVVDALLAVAQRIDNNADQDPEKEERSCRDATNNTISEMLTNDSANVTMSLTRTPMVTAKHVAGSSRRFLPHHRTPRHEHPRIKGRFQYE